MLDFTQHITSGNLKQLDETHLSVELTEGKLSSSKPCFVCDESGEEYVIISSKILKNLLEGMKKAQEERFAISLEKDIANLMPLDFEDVLSVAKSKLAELNLDISQVNTLELIKDIKREHPNLFFNLDDYLRK